MKIDGKSLLYGVLAAIGIIAFYITVLTIFQSYGFAMSEFKRLWVWLVPLAIGFGTQIGLYTSIRHDAKVNRGMAASTGVSGGSMIACCSHYLLSIIPLIGITGLSAFTSFLMTYQKAFFSIGIASSIIGISLMVNHKRKMEKNEFLKHANSNSLKEMKGGLRLMATKEESDTIHISGKAIAAIIILVLLLVSTFGMFILNSSHNTSKSTTQSSSNGDIPEKCKLPAGEDVTAWKEHLGHHAETQDCLKYFN